MEKIFKNIFPEIKAIIKHYSDAELNDPNTVANLVARYWVVSPEVIPENIVILGDDTATRSNATIEVGKKIRRKEVYYVEYQIRFQGLEKVIFAASRDLPPLDRSQGKWFENDSLYLKYYSSIPIIGNYDVIESITAKAREEVGMYENAFEIFRPQVDEFNNYVKTFIENTISEEINNRIVDAVSLAKLMLFKV